MTLRNQFFLTVSFLALVLGITLFSILRRDREPTRIFPAMVDRDCAPWDGAAFTVSIPLDEAVIQISIYRSPEIRLPVTFSFPDGNLRDGNALLLLAVGVPEPLTGKVHLQRVEQDLTVDGRFDLATQAGREFSGKFKAEWGNEIVYCG